MKFAQLREGKIIYFEEADDIADLKKKYNPNTNWIDVTNIECGLGWTVTHNENCEMVFTPPAKPKPPSFEELKESKLNEAHLLFEQKRDAVVWVDTSVGHYGFDTASEDIVNFMAAKMAAEEFGKTYYKVWLTESTKGMIEIPAQDFLTVFNQARQQQLQAYAWFEEVRKAINDCKTIEALEVIKFGN